MLNPSSLVAFLLYALPSLAFALPVVDVMRFDCGGQRTIAGDADLTIGCSGDLLLADGSITADGALTISATGVLSLVDVTLSAPNVVIHAGALILNAGSHIGTDSFSATGLAGDLLSSFVASPGATISVGGVVVDRSLTPEILSAGLTTPAATGGTLTITPEVPEPSTYALLVAGLGCLAVAARARRA